MEGSQLAPGTLHHCRATAPAAIEIISQPWIAPLTERKTVGPKALPQGILSVACSHRSR